MKVYERKRPELFKPCEVGSHHACVEQITSWNWERKSGGYDKWRCSCPCHKEASA